jgi:hypothetical protein
MLGIENSETLLGIIILTSAMGAKALHNPSVATPKPPEIAGGNSQPNIKTFFLFVLIVKCTLFL